MSIKLFFAGDIVLAEGKAELSLCSEELNKHIRECDVVCCNFEAPVATGLAKKKKVGPNNQNCEETVKILKQAGFNLATLANNHIFDYGIEGIAQTKDILCKSGIDSLGAGVTRKEVYEPYVFFKDNAKIGIVNMAENGFGAAVDNGDSYGYSYIFSEENKCVINRLKNECDVLIAVCHAGAEMWDFPLPEWRDVYRNMIDDGVDVVIAHHPHVPQGYEEYNGGNIFYSLGNTAFDKGNGAKRPETYCVKVEIDNKKVSCNVIPTIFENGILDVNRSEEFSNHLEECCELLKDETRYIEEVNKKCIQSYNTIYKNAYGRVVCDYRGNIKEWIKGIVKKVVFRIRFQEIWLYHNISIETHLYICKRATRLLLKQEQIL